MIYIEHRRNLISDLANVHSANGVEIDLRSIISEFGKLHLAHDPWAAGDNFEDWLKEFVRLGIKGPLILNTKEDGLENRIRQILEIHKVKNYLFLDTTVPTLVANVLQGRGEEFILRLSCYEDLENSLKFKSKVKWMWVDCFEKVPIPIEVLKEAKKHFLLCLVSPELQKGDGGDFGKFENHIRIADAVCTKLWAEWSHRLKNQ